MQSSSVTGIDESHVPQAEYASSVERAAAEIKRVAGNRGKGSVQVNRTLDMRNQTLPQLKSSLASLVPRAGVAL